jgi:hypothetical protein
MCATDGVLCAFGWSDYESSHLSHAQYPSSTALAFHWVRIFAYISFGVTRVSFGKGGGKFEGVVHFWTCLADAGSKVGYVIPIVDMDTYGISHWT